MNAFEKNDRTIVFGDGRFLMRMECVYCNTVVWSPGVVDCFHCSIVIARVEDPMVGVNFAKRGNNIILKSICDCYNNSDDDNE